MIAFKKIDTSCTIVICAFNSEKHIAHTINSCFVSSGSVLPRLLIVDDCSSDKTLEILKVFAGQYPDNIKLVVNKSNLGLTKSLVKATSLVETKFFARLDAEDINYDGRIEQQVAQLEDNPMAICCSCDYRLINVKGDLIREIKFQHNMMIVHYYQLL